MDESIWQIILNLVESPKFYVPVISICVSILFIKSSNRLVKRLITSNSNKIEIKRRNTIVSLVQNIIKYIIIIFAGLVCLRAWEFDVSGIIAGLGVAGVVGGLALQDALKDIIMGCNIIMDNYFVVGDSVTFEGFTGEVIEFGLKNTKIKNADGVVYVIANREISKIYNLSQKNSNVYLKIPVAYEESEANVAKILNKVCKVVDGWELTDEETEYLGIDSLEDSSVIYLVRASCKAGDQYELKRKMLAFVKSEFDKNNIKIPYPQIEVHNGKRV